MNPLVVIPARFASSRFPGKPLVEIAGKTLLQRVHERVLPVVGRERVLIATDDERIRRHCEASDMNVVMTSSACLTGTDRVAEVARHVEADVYINVQGDEPLIEPADVQAVIDAAQQLPDRVINAMCPIVEEADFRSRTVPKVVAAPDGRLLYMSRAPIPGTKGDAFVSAHKQVCIYAFPLGSLAAFAAQSAKSPLEEIEDIEILRFLEMGIGVHMVTVSGSSVAVDVPEDVDRVLAVLAQKANT